MDKYIHAFWHIEGNYYQRLDKIARHFGDWKYAWEKAKSTELSRAGLDQAVVEKIMIRRKNLDLNKALDLLWSNDIFLVDQASPEFPTELKQISRPPFLLYRKGAPLHELANRVAIVGMRKASSQGEKLAFGLARNLATQGITVVSGLAFGIDAAAHAGTLKAEGKTIGILASGIGKITPSTHHSLAEKILATGGAIISEYPVTAEALKFQFVERNRIIAGLSHTVIIVEAGKKSGALITAKHALEQGREILAFPGDPGRIQSQGCNDLIKKGEAQLVDSISDVQENLKGRSLIKYSRRTMRLIEANLNRIDLKTLEAIERNRCSTDELDFNLASHWGPEGRGLLIESLSKLEMAGLIVKSSQLKWQRLMD